LSHAGGAARPAFAPATVSSGDASVLVLYAHPAAHRSRVNRRLVEVARSVPGVTVHDLYEAYPDFLIDVEAEQALLLKHDTIVFQHPMYWYSTPAVLKEWQDLVLTYGWAYGTGGTALTGKRWLSALSTGGPDFAYQRDRGHGFTLTDLLAPLIATARLCHMEWLDPFVVHGTHRLDDAAIAVAADAYRARLMALHANRRATA
jgi:glutathione-regulated potassium-efflux system ancillary protein KefG